MSTFGGGYKIFGAASGGQVLGGSQAAFVTYNSTGSANAGIMGTLYYGPGQTIPVSFVSGFGTWTFVSGIVFEN